MAEMKDAHVVEIPVDEEHQQKLLCSSSTTMDMVSSAIQHHPLMEISQSPGHLLLLKLWQREEDLFGRRIARKETRMDSIKREIFQLCCFFLLFHGFFLTLLFTSSVRSDVHVCKKKWWIPSLLSVSTSLVFVFLVQIKLFRFWKVWTQLQREKNDNRALSRCIQELRMKGSSFDLSKEPLSGKRMKSSSVEIKWKPLTWCSQYLITICLVCFAGLVFPASKLILCWL
ncbi:RNA polymerase II elongation factor [Trema orientale]|uniref:RNA polymerase II elongation factor n=1 Tax=Trema orientale TaxID=63057 RepID=A0A2P5FYM7_TREOI|nr:RNA polymerase II elongation factor [Trema orientale]